MSRGYVIAGTDTDAGKTVFAAALCGALGARYWKPIQCGLEGGGDVEVVRKLGGLSGDHIVPEIYRLKMPASPHRAAEIDGVEIDVDRLATAVATLSRTHPTSSPSWRNHAAHGRRGPVQAGGLAVPTGDEQRHGQTPAFVGVTAQGEWSSLRDTRDPERPDTTLIIEGAGGLMVPLTRNVLQIDLFARWGMPVVLCARTALGTINHSLLSFEALNNRNIPIHGIAFIGDANADSERTICDMGGVRRLGRLPLLDPLDKGTLAAAFAAGFRREDFA